MKLIEGNVYLVNNIVEKPRLENASSDFAWMGRAVLTPEIFTILEKTEPGVGGEIQITDAIKKLLELQKVYGLEVQGKRFDTGNKLDYLKTVVDFALKREDIGGEFKEFLKSKG